MVDQVEKVADALAKRWLELESREDLERVWAELARAAIAAYNPNERLTAPTDEMIEAMHKMSDEMLARERSAKPEEMPDYDEGDMCRTIYVAMCAAAQPPQVNPNERLREALEEAREAIASLDTEALGMAQIGFGEPGVDVYPIRDELLAKIDAALTPPSGLSE